MRQLILFCEDVSIEIRYAAKALDDILEKAKNSYVDCDFLQKLAHGSRFHESWRQAVSTEKSLTPADKEILQNFGSELGRSDIEGQVAVINLTSELLKRQLAEAEEQSAKKATMYRSVGFLCGLATAIILI